MDADPVHYNDVIMGAMASQISSLTIVYSTFYSGTDERKHQKLRATGLCVGNSPVTGEFPAQMASNADNVSNSVELSMDAYLVKGRNIHFTTGSHVCACLVKTVNEKLHILHILALAKGQ